MTTYTDHKNTSAVLFSGNAYVDSFLFSKKWDLISSNVITYSFPTTFSNWDSEDYGSNSEIHNGYSIITSSVIQNQIRDALSAWQNVANVSFIEVADNGASAGDIRFAFTQAPANVQAYAYIPVDSPVGGDIWFNKDSTSFTDADWEKGSHEYFTVIHELGHALGLDHPFESDYSGVPLPPELDYIWHTVMAYNDHLNGNVYSQFKPTTPMHLDIDAIHYLYGANIDYNSGDTLYLFQQNQQYLETIWDGGGVDTIQYNATSVGGEIDLRPGEWSQLGAGTALYNFNGTLNRIEKDSINIFKSVLSTGYEVIIENAIGSAFDDRIIGNKVANRLEGNAGNDSLDGAYYQDRAQTIADIDTLVGGLGDDSYYVDHLNDQITELSNQGNDTIHSYITYSIENKLNIENLTLVGTLDTEATGNIRNNYIKGNAANNSALYGGAGVDILEGGMGDDTYLVDLFQTATDPTVAKLQLEDTIIEGSNAGTDTIKLYGEFFHNTYTTISLTGAYANFENINLIETFFSKINITGNASNNTLIGNDEANTIDGGAGQDNLVGGKGGDTYVLSHLNETIIEEFDEGDDLVNVNIFVTNGSYSLEENVERATVTSNVAFNLTGNALRNTLIGNAASNVLNGGSGADIMTGGNGNDFYFVDNAGDQTVEVSGRNTGVDTVNSSITLTLAASIENLILLGTEHINGTGNSLSNIIQGNAGHNVISGGVGAEADTVSYENASNGVLVNLNSQTATGFGNDSLHNIEAAIGSNFSDILRGGAGANFLEGLAGNDTIDGDSGADTLRGGQGDDTFIIDIQATGVLQDTYIELIGEGNDTVQLRGSSTNTLAHNITIGAQVENMNAIGTNLSLLNINGNILNNIITGNNAANTLNGLAGADTMLGGLGNDTYVVDNIGDFVSETTSNINGGGIDLVQSSVTFILGEHLDNLTLTGSALANGTGNVLNNNLVGNSAINILDGGLGEDSMSGGAGDDSYYIENTGDIVTELANEGVDTINSLITFNLTDTDGLGVSGGNVENLFLLGTNNINGSGNQLDNLIQGNLGNNLIVGNAGNDVLRGGGGTDTLIGGTGDDVYFVDGLEDVVTETLADILTGGVDTIQSTVTYTLAGRKNIERLTLLGVNQINGTGNELNNWLTGNAVSNVLIDNVGDDTLDGGVGDDILQGGIGNDTYIIDSVDDVVIESEANSVIGGIDTVESSVSYSLNDSQYVENIRLTKLNAINATGNSLANIITGNFASNILNGGAGNDTLIGGAGKDSLNGGDGFDTVSFIDASGNVTVNLSLAGNQVTSDGHGSSDALSSIENITGSTKNDTITGDNNNNVLDGVAGNDVVSGGEGDDTLIGGNGNDILIGGLGIDTVSFASSTSGVNVNLVFNTANDGFGGIDTLESLERVIGSAFNDFIQGDDHENTLEGGSGVDTIYGGGGSDTINSGVDDDVIDGGLGADVMAGGDGKDIYLVDDIADVVIETNASATFSEVDRVESTVTYTLGANVEQLTLLGTSAINGTGNMLSNILIGNAAANVLNGGIGSDSMIGGDGNDVYFVDYVGDIVTETNSNVAIGGVDQVRSFISYTLGQHLESLSLLGTAAINGSGNSLKNVLTGNAAANTLNGAAGEDVMMGGDGNDVYIVDNVGDSVQETNANLTVGGNDQVKSFISYKLGQNVERLMLIGTAAINGSGNNLNNVLTGNSSANTLNGEGGGDSMLGGDGNDIYIVDNIGDRVTETNANSATGGIDQVKSFVSYKLGQNLERLMLIGTAAIDGIGNSLNNFVIGNDAANSLNGEDGDDRIIGGAGKDKLTGGLGSDRFIFNATFDALVGVNRDEITDFNSLQKDKIDFSAIDANTTLGGNQAFSASILTSGPFTMVGQLKFEGGILYGNTDSNFETSEFEVALTGVGSVQATDFML